MGEAWNLPEGGRLTAQVQGDRVLVEVSRPDQGHGLYKAWLRGPGGELLLGTLLPQSGELRLSRRLPLADLERRGIWPLTGGVCRLIHPFGGASEPPSGWVREEAPARLFPGDDILARSAAGLGAVLRRERSDGFCLAFPFRCDRPFGLTPAFCFARLCQMNGGNWVVFRFRADGWPVFPCEEGQNAGLEREDRVVTSGRV